MFVEKLTDKQVKSFLEQQYPPKEGWSYSWHFWNDEQNYSCSLEREQNNYVDNIRLEDFFSDGGSTKAWVKYLYGIFGEEYKQEYVKVCLKIFD